ncbi:hypothetical protein B0H16DRAFT_1500517 [Mycena metata]|uniref:Secreted protein n=1 Tax=Mycena metata TaxID=1033252 RepID=A0AAD7K7S5_9AGAR|nr:hypothetical protein B0H16DRAFT_1500517 [Mycena metata]
MLLIFLGLGLGLRRVDCLLLYLLTVDDHEMTTVVSHDETRVGRNRTVFVSLITWHDCYLHPLYDWQPPPPLVTYMHVLAVYLGIRIHSLTRCFTCTLVRVRLGRRS